MSQEPCLIPAMLPAKGAQVLHQPPTRLDLWAHRDQLLPRASQHQEEGFLFEENPMDYCPCSQTRNSAAGANPAEGGGKGGLKAGDKHQEGSPGWLGREPWHCWLCSWLPRVSLQMPQLSTQHLQGCEELHLAHLVLSFITMGYVWQEGEEGTVQVKAR